MYNNHTITELVMVKSIYPIKHHSDTYDYCTGRIVKHYFAYQTLGWILQQISQWQEGKIWEQSTSPK